MFFFFKQKTAYEMLRSLVGSEMCIRDRISMPSVVIKLSSGLNKTIEVTSFDITVADLKELAANDIDIPADQQRPVFKGKMIKDTDKLSTLGVTEGSAIHVVRGRGAAPVSYTHLTLPTKRIV
eukprot:TRINITY_DN46800_c0_g1_i2.p1 TRINITY_DN46800_c0_g1~~TRINITY_DN46800_c0_g1_i2.p1  ORF type:complete len:123 (-),score=43.50 TRINITY_DN46800_c0_g1_i2:81-449(-)